MPCDDENDEFAQPGGQNTLVPQIVTHRSCAAHDLGASQERDERSRYVGPAGRFEFCNRLLLRVGHLVDGYRRHAVLCHCVDTRGENQYQHDREAMRPRRNLIATHHSKRPSRVSNQKPAQCSERPSVFFSAVSAVSAVNDFVTRSQANNRPPSTEMMEPVE